MMVHLVRQAHRLGPLAVAVVLLSGQVTDRSSGKPLPGVEVLLTSSTTNRSAYTFTDARGRYRIRNVARGRYLVSVEGGMVPTQLFHVTIGSKRAQTANFVACSLAMNVHCGTTH